MQPVYKAVRSSNIAALAYADGKGWVEFHGGRRFAYVMPESLFTEMAEAVSIGSFFARHVKGKFEVAATSHRCVHPGCQEDAIPTGSPEPNPRCSLHMGDC